MSVFERFSQEQMAVLKARAERVARAAAEEDAGSLFGVLTVTIGAEQYALPVEWLTAVFDDVSVVPVPCTPDYVGGIANIRGHIVPVIHLAHLLNVAVAPGVEFNKLIVLSNNELTLAVQVSGIGDVLNVSEHDLSAVPGDADIAQGVYMRGILPDGAVVLDVRAILEDPALNVAEGVSR
jgi:purine-binding chemotaxis protein CheW